MPLGFSFCFHTLKLPLLCAVTFKVPLLLISSLVLPPLVSLTQVSAHLLPSSVSSRQSQLPGFKILSGEFQAFIAPSYIGGPLLCAVTFKVPLLLISSLVLPPLVSLTQVSAHLLPSSVSSRQSQLPGFKISHPYFPPLT